MTRTEPDDQTDHHARKDRHDRLVYRANTLDLEIVGCDEGANQKETEDTQAPSVG